MVTRTFKSHVLQMLPRSFLRLRISQVDCLGDSSSTTLDTLHTTPIEVIPLFARLAILQWSVDSEPDLLSSPRTLLDELPVDADVADTPRYTLKVSAQVLLLLTISSTQTNGPSLVKLLLHLALIGFAIATRTPRCARYVPYMVPSERCLSLQS